MSTGNGTTGQVIKLKNVMEIRTVIVAEGIQYHDIYIPFLKSKLTDFKSTDSLSGTYTNDLQQVCYEVKVVRSRKDFKEALETQNAIVIYDGHSRYGRGACFDPKNLDTGDQWQNGNSESDGIFRMGYPFIPVEESDIEHHGYNFNPWPVENGAPMSEKIDPFSRHPDARRQLFKESMPAALKNSVLASHRSPSNQYFGYTDKKEKNFLFDAGWESKTGDPDYLGSIEMKCKTFCHFGCSSRLHFRPIIRYSAYYGWSLPKSRTEHFAYFTTAPSDSETAYWLYNLLRCPLPNGPLHWWDTHEWAKKKTNQYLAEISSSFRIY